MAAFLRPFREHVHDKPPDEELVISFARETCCLLAPLKTTSRRYGFSIRVLSSLST
jgi:hypothetical protein